VSKASVTAGGCGSCAFSRRPDGLPRSIFSRVGCGRRPEFQLPNDAESTAAGYLQKRALSRVEYRADFSANISIAPITSEPVLLHPSTSCGRLASIDGAAAGLAVDEQAGRSVDSCRQMACRSAAGCCQVRPDCRGESAAEVVRFRSIRK
jgi:hypothetical protein